MSQAIKTQMTFEEYLRYDDGTDKHYEFEGGNLVEMPPESPLNSRIARFLFVTLLSTFSEDLICHKDTEVAVSGTQVKARLPDLMLLSEGLAEMLNSTSRGTISLEMPPPSLIVEVVSPGEPGSDNFNRDYVEKRKEYAERGIPEYWLIDPMRGVVIVLQLDSGRYVERKFEGSDRVISPTFSDLQLTAEQILRAGR